jgi:hypothetical protein
MSQPLKVMVFVLAFNVIGFAEGSLLRDLGLVLLVVILIVTGSARAGESVVAQANEWQLRRLSLSGGGSLCSSLARSDLNCLLFIE